MTVPCGLHRVLCLYLWISLFIDWVHVGAVSVKTSHTFRIQVIRLHILQLEPVYFPLLPFHQVVLTTSAEMGPNLIWVLKIWVLKILVTKKFGPREIWSPRNLGPHEFHYMSFSCRDLISFGPYFSVMLQSTEYK